MNYTHIMDKIVSTPWLITEDSLQNILNILDQRIQGNMPSEEMLAPYAQDDSIEEDTSASGIGILNINGPIFPKANMMTQMSGATSIQQLQSNFRDMLSNDQITSIVLNIDSPGGMSDLIMEMGDEIFAARGTKPIVAVANTTAASAAYWLGSQAEKFYVTPSGRVGSVGVYTVHEDRSGKLEKEGIKTTIISAGKYKVEGSSIGPLSDDAKSHIQERVDETFTDFISAVARGRGQSVEQVTEHYANGRTYPAKTADALKMVDGIATFDSVVGDMVEYSNSGGFSNTTGGTYQFEVTSTGINDPFTGSYVIPIPTNTKEGEKMEGFTPETLEALGLSEGATDEEIHAAVTQMTAEVAPIRNAAEAQRAFAEQFPEQAAKLEELSQRDVKTSATLFRDSYEKFSADSKHGFSSVALEMIGETHEKISNGSVTHEDFKAFLDLFSEGTAVVDYTERGTSREAEAITAEDARDAGKQLATLAMAAQSEAGGVSKLSWGDALAQVSATNPELARLYQESVGGGE